MIDQNMAHNPVKDPTCIYVPLSSYPDVISFTLDSYHLICEHCPKHPLLCSSNSCLKYLECKVFPRLHWSHALSEFIY